MRWKPIRRCSFQLLLASLVLPGRRCIPGSTTQLSRRPPNTGSASPLPLTEQAAMGKLTRWREQVRSQSWEHSGRQVVQVWPAERAFEQVLRRNTALAGLWPVTRVS